MQDALFPRKIPRSDTEWNSESEEAASHDKEHDFSVSWPEDAKSKHRHKKGLRRRQTKENYTTPQAIDQLIWSWSLSLSFLSRFVGNQTKASLISCHWKGIHDTQPTDDRLAPLAKLHTCQRKTRFIGVSAVSTTHELSGFRFQRIDFWASAPRRGAEVLLYYPASDHTPSLSHLSCKY